MLLKDELYWRGFMVYLQRKKFHDISFLSKGLTKKLGNLVKNFRKKKKPILQNNYTWIIFIFFNAKKNFLNEIKNIKLSYFTKEKSNISAIGKNEKYSGIKSLKNFENKSLKFKSFQNKLTSKHDYEKLNIKHIIGHLTESGRTKLKSKLSGNNFPTKVSNKIKNLSKIKKTFKGSFLTKQTKKSKIDVHSKHNVIIKEKMYKNQKDLYRKGTRNRFCKTNNSIHWLQKETFKAGFQSVENFLSFSPFLFCGRKSQILKSWGQVTENFPTFIIFSPYNIINQAIEFFDFDFTPNLKKKKIQINGVIYEKLELIGKGGTGKVYKILDSKKNVFALKKMKIHSFGIENLHSCINEISILKMLRGQNRVVRLENVDISLKNGVIYMVLEYGECDLGCLLKQNPKNLSKNPFLKFLWREIIEAVHTIHQERIVHGDLKPANFLVVGSSLKIIDFGIAKPIQNDTTNITRTSQIGTLNYMSPESVLDIPSFCERKKRFKLSRSADIWSLGCIFFQMVYGKTPFHHLSFMKKIQAIVNKSFDIPFLPGKPSRIVDVLKNCLQRNPENRPSIPELLRHPFLIPENFRISIKKNGL